jgi:hypothetical protein
MTAGLAILRIGQTGSKSRANEEAGKPQMANGLDLVVDGRRSPCASKTLHLYASSDFSRLLLSSKRNFPGARRVLHMPGGGSDARG